MLELTNDELVLRPPQADDASAVYAAVRESVVEVGRWLTWCSASYAREDAEAWVRVCREAWQHEAGYPFFIFDRASKEFLGGCGLNELDRERLRANLGYWVRASRHGQGIATAAALLVARFGLFQLGFERLEIVAAVGNTASQRVAEKTGAQREGTLRNRLRVRGVQHDALCYSLIRSDFERH